MISHKYKCIFVHIPRTAGTSIEVALCGGDWWRIDKETKHITASAAKVIYKDYWDEYFTFSFVRNPWDRMASMATFPAYFGACKASGKLNIDLYLGKFKNGEIDTRFSNLGKKWGGGSDTVYLQILDEELDFIGRFENLQNDFDTVCDKVGVSRRQLPYKEKSKHNHYTEYYDDETRQLVAERYAKDIECFGYKFGE